MKELKWNYDERTAYWANRLLLPDTSTPHEQYDVSDRRFRKNTWKKHILNDSFPQYCHYPQQQGYLLSSPDNIIKCFEEGKLLEALALTVAWGGMARTKGKRIYTKSNQVIEEILLECLEVTKGKNSIEDAWELLVGKLHWTDVMTSKCLHFLARSLGYETNPPVPIDNKVIIKRVWPKFKKRIKRIIDQGSSSDPGLPGGWRGSNASWEAYNRYMTAINCWANLKGWTTTEVENTIFKEYSQRSG